MNACAVTADLNRYQRQQDEQNSYDNALALYREEAQEELESDAAAFVEVLDTDLEDEGRALRDRILFDMAMGRPIPAEMQARWAQVANATVAPVIKKRAEQLLQSANDY